MKNQDLYKKQSDDIWEIANLLRGPYRPPQYRRVMIPLTVLRRLDCVLEATKEDVLKEYKKLTDQKKHDKETIEKIINKKFNLTFHNTSKFTFQKMLGDADGLAKNLNNYIAGFSSRARGIIEKFKFDEEIEKLDEANRLFDVFKKVASQDLHPDKFDNMGMGYIFEDLVRRFNEQANEEAGDHFTPREVIKLMVNILFSGEEQIYKAGKLTKIYDPTCGTGGILSVSENTILEQNDKAEMRLFGQEYNPESYAICGSDLMIKGEDVSNIAFGDTLGTGKVVPGRVDGDGHPNERFHYMAANPPFGVEWKPEQDYVTAEHETESFRGRFGPGLPRINDGALLFLLHMISKMQTPPEHYTLGPIKGIKGGEGSRIAIVFNGSPLFTGDAGSGESNIRRYIIENDMLDAVIGLPDQMFYNTGIYTYIWIVTNRKNPKRQGKVQLINATDFAWKMKKSLGNKRKKLGEGTDGEPDHITALTKIYADFKHDNTRTLSQIKTNVELPKKGARDQDKIIYVSKIFKNQEFAYLKITVERPLRLNFAVTDERITAFSKSAYFTNLAVSQKRKNKAAMDKEIVAGKAHQQAILDVLNDLKPDFTNGELIKNRNVFEDMLKNAFSNDKQFNQIAKWDAALNKALLTPGALAERDKTADICTDSKGNPEPDTELRDTENVPLPLDLELPLPLAYENKKQNKGKVDKDDLLALVQAHCENYLKKEVLPYRPDAWIDHSKIKLGYEIPFNRHFYQYEPPRDLAEIEADIKGLEKEIMDMLAEVV
ncbi:class I SAM-dependent DNA methyltransferase [Candidatus Kuenenia sp.]|uniref:type I restriction-modification system subunit M n=1 Tax=Candidatus Kuenenia sp. TaxID=2499824 RepID=UPI00321FFD47